MATPATGSLAERLKLLPSAQKHILAMEDGKNRLIAALRDLSGAFALAVPHAEALRIRDDASFFQAVQAWSPSARRDLAAWLARWGNKYPKLCDWVEANIEETLAFYRLPRQHPKHMKSTNMLERLDEEIKRRTRVIRIFPNEAGCLRLVRACAVETHENWIEATRYLNMELLEERKKALRREAA